MERLQYTIVITEDGFQVSRQAKNINERMLNGPEVVVNQGRAAGKLDALSKCTQCILKEIS